MQPIRWTDEAQQGFPYWWEGLDDLPLDDVLPTRCDLLVIGAGYTGLSGAIAAHDAGAKVVVVDAGTPGKGASTRNGGMFGAHPKLSWSNLAARFGPETADGLFAEAAPALEWAKALIEQENINCDMQQTGRIQLAWTTAQFAAQQQLLRDVRAKSGVEIEALDRQDLGQEITTERYFGGIVFPQHCAIHPAKFHRGLLRAALGRGIPVVTHAEVAVLTREGVEFTAKTPKGGIRANKVLLATNGYTTGGFRSYMRRVFPVPSYLIATEPLPPDLIAHLAPGRRMMVETRARHSYFRISPDGTRLIYGGRASLQRIDLAQAARRLHQTMCEVWPDLTEVKLSHVWTGLTGYSFNHMPNVGETNGLHHAMGYSGSGTVMAPYLGAKAAYQALGDARGQTAYTGTRLKRSVLHPGTTPHFLKAADFWYQNWIDWRDHRQGR